MVQAKFTEGVITFLNGEAAKIRENRLVKLKAGSTTTPPEVVYADAGEMPIGFTSNHAEVGAEVAVIPLVRAGTFLATSAGSYAYNASLYVANDGKVDDVSSGSVLFKAVTAAGAADEEQEVILHPSITGVAGTTSYDNSGGETANTDVQAAILEIFTHIQSAKKTLLPLDRKSVV